MYGMTYKDAPNYVNQFLMPQQTLDMFIRQPGAEEHINLNMP